MMGTRTPNLSRVSTILGTAAAACSVLTVTRTNSDPARASAMTWLTVDGHIGGVRIGHGLHDDRMIAPYPHTSDVYRYRPSTGFYSHASSGKDSFYHCGPVQLV